MSEELKPCPNPKCGCKTPRVIKEFSGDTEFFFVVCPDCSMAGPIEACSRDAAIAAWNSLPRAPHITPNDADCKGCPERRPGLAWTKEPPKVSGNYWWICGQEQPDEPQMVNVVLSEGRFHFFFHYSEGPFFHECDSCRWAGPIPGPEESDQ